MSKHTSGPWGLYHVGNRQEIWDKEGVTIAVVPVYHATPRESEANAALIAAAPDLLAALQEMVDVAQNQCPSEQEDDALRSALTAINKAGDL